MALPAVKLESELRRDGTVLITLRGEIDMATAGDVEAAIMSAARAAPRGVVLDLASSFVDLHGYRALSRAQAAIRQEGKTFVLLVDAWQAKLNALIESDGEEHLNTRMTGGAR